MLLPFFQSDVLEAGIDEAGRGCYAGPVFAAAVILAPDFSHPDLNDSKKLSPTKREMLRPIIEQESIAWAVASVPNSEIDEVNILQATYKAMHIAVRNLTVTPEFLLVDGNRFKEYPDIPHKCIIHGDGLYASIAAAGILAKTHRDELMNALDKNFPQYGWQKNKGYGTPEHRKAIEIYGLSPFHRKSFKI
ncbi:MAG: ribonuclease HII [Chitinophagaceae bacterium]|nr:ribonuclease HII [Chitinophagaceae bacterium]